MAGAETDPHAAYADRLERRRARAAELSRVELWISAGRLAVAAAGAVAGWLALVEGSIAAWWLAPPVAAFLALVVVHERAIRARRRCERAAAFHKGCLERLEGRWQGQGPTGERFLAGDHLYAADLDLFGPGSLFEMLCAARTGSGEETLAAWLKQPAPPEEVRRRQEAVAELRGRLDLREDLALAGEDVRAAVDPGALVAWAEAPALLPAARWALAARLGGAALTLAAVACLSAWGAGAAGPTPFALAVVLELAAAVPLRGRVRGVVGTVERSARDLQVLDEVLARLESESFASEKLAGLRAELQTLGSPASRRIARLRLLVELLDARRNQLFAPLAGLLLWTTQVAWFVEDWRRRNGPEVARWLAAVGEIEALASLAGRAFDHPDDPFAEVVPAPRDGGAFEAEGLGHPLIPPDRCVRNDLRLGGSLRLLVVSGSNMSGKSTLLRAVGVNAALALAGAPVRAGRLRMSALQVGASIRVQDSLLEGRSRFYAEITRLKRIVDLASGPEPALFLIDELLNGTNSHDRRIGAEAVVRALVGRGAIGLVTTHDLALSEIASALSPRAANVHFEDHLQDGHIAFDYRLRPGVVTKSNALELMRAVGLET